MSAAGATKPITIMIASVISSTGVRMLPTMSTTLDGLIVSTRTIAKYTTENTASAILLSIPVIGVNPISNVVAAVLGVATSTPIQSIIIALITTPIF